MKRGVIFYYFPQPNALKRSDKLPLQVQIFRENKKRKLEDEKANWSLEECGPLRNPMPLQ